MASHDTKKPGNNVYTQGRSWGGGGSWGARDPPFVGLLLSQRKRHDNILAVKAIVEKPTFFKFVFL